MSIKKTALAAAMLLTATGAYAFTEYPAGEPQTINEMEIAAVYHYEIGRASCRERV